MSRDGGEVRFSALAPGKINLCLFLGGVLGDGRHELVTVLESVSLADRVALLSGVAPDGVAVAADDEVVCEGVGGRNLAQDALAALREHGWGAGPVRIEIDKRVPVAGGMGGGSADAAAVLRLALRVAAPAPGVLAEIAASLGSDVPSQLAPGLMRGTGAGDVVEPLEPLAPHALVLLPLPFVLSTADVYREADRLRLPRASADLHACRKELADTLQPGARLPDRLLINDLAPAARSLCPAIDDALRDAGAAGADNTIVCGSGPTVAGLFWGERAPERAAAAAQQLVDRYPDAVPATPVDAAFGMPVPG